MITFIVFQPKHLCDKPWVYFAIDSMQNDFTLKPSTSKWIRVIHFQGSQVQYTKFYDYEVKGSQDILLDNVEVSIILYTINL